MYQCLAPGMIGVDQPFSTSIDLAVDAGFGGIQLSLEYLREHGPDAVAATLDEHDLGRGSPGVPVRYDAPSEEYESGLERLQDIAPDLAAAGCTRLSTYVLSFSDERDFEENFAYHVERLTPIAATLADHDIRLGLEYLGPETLRADHDYEFIHTSAGMLDLCAAIEADNVGLLVDCWHWYTAGESVADLLELSNDDIVDVHLNDAPERPRTEQIDDERAMPATTGVIDVAGFLGALDDIGYNGPVAVEPFSDELAARPDEEAVAETKASLDRAWDRAGL